MISNVRYIKQDIKNGVLVDVFLYKDTKNSLLGKTKRIVFDSVLNMSPEDVEKSLN